MNSSPAQPQNEKFVTISLLLILNALLALCVGGTSHVTQNTKMIILFVCSAISILSSVSFFFKFRTYNLLRVNTREESNNAAWLCPRQCYNTNQRDLASAKAVREFYNSPQDELNGSMIDSPHPKIRYRLDKWEYESGRRRFFCFFNPISVVGLTIVQYNCLDDQYKLMLVVFSVIHSLMMHFMTRRYETSQIHQMLINNEAMFEQMRTSDVVWNTASHLVLKKRSNPYLPTLELNSIANVPTYVDDSYVPTSAMDYDDMDEDDDFEVHEDTEKKLEMRRNSLAQREEFMQCQREINQEIQQALSNY